MTDFRELHVPIPLTAEQETQNVNAYFHLRDAEFQAEAWTRLSCAWQRTYELKSGSIDDDESRAAAHRLIEDVLASTPVDGHFAEQQEALRTFLS